MPAITPFLWFNDKAEESGEISAGGESDAADGQAGSAAPAAAANEP